MTTITGFSSVLNGLLEMVGGVRTPPVSDVGLGQPGPIGGTPAPLSGAEAGRPDGPSEDRRAPDVRLGRVSCAGTGLLLGRREGALFEVFGAANVDVLHLGGGLVGVVVDEDP